jgi:cytochrome c-type biogenesis protein CcmH
MQREIRRRLAAGDSPAEVKRYFVSRYGEWILLQPRAEGINLLVYLLPALALLAGLVLAWRQIRSWAAAGEREAAAAADASVRAEGDGRDPATAGGGDGGGLSREEEERVDALVREG